MPRILPLTQSRPPSKIGIRKPDLQVLLAANGKAEAIASVSAFNARYRFDDCASGDLLALADLGVTARDANFSRSALLVTLERGERVEFAHLKFGLLELRAGNYAEAADHFTRGVEANPTFGGNLLGLARAQKLRGQIPAARAAAARWFALDLPSPRRPDDVLLLSELGGNGEAGEDAPKQQPGLQPESVSSKPDRDHRFSADKLLESNSHIEAARSAIESLRIYNKADHAESLTDAQKSLLLRIAHGCFDLDRGLAYTLYDHLQKAGAEDYLCGLRLIEVEIERGQISIASQKMKAFAKSYMLDPWGMFAKAQIQHAQGHTTRAVETVLAAVNAAGATDYCKIVAGYRLLDFRAFNEASQFQYNELQPLLGRNPAWDGEIRGLKFRHAVLRSDHQAILSLLKEPEFLAHNPVWMTVEALFIFALPGEQIKPQDIEIATTLAKYLETVEPCTLGSVLSLYQFYSRRRMWGHIASLEARITGTPLNDHYEVVMRRFESLCAMSRMQDAKELYEKHYAGAELRQWEACVVLRFLAEAKMWDETGHQLLRFIEKGYYFPSGEYFLLKICRRAKLHRNIITLIDETTLAEPPAQFSVLRELLADDLVLQEGSKTLPGKQFLGVMSEANRFLFKSPLSSDAKISAVGFLCADKAYFLSLLTFLASVAFNAHDEAIGVWYVFLAADVPDLWFGILQRLALKLNLRLTIVAEKDFVDSDAVHVETYGIFTGGNTLSRAAFLRIYAAKYLLTKAAGFERAMYFDTDIICQSGLDSFVGLSFDNALLMARAEEPSPEVQSVVERHGLSTDGYFNSGVLSFNFKDADIGRFLDEAIRLSEQESARLIFHDQCALNLAFKDRVLYLEPKYNFFLRPHRPDNGETSDAVLLHFLDKPKPWDLSYMREYRPLWLGYVKAVRALLTANNYNKLVMAANQ